MPIEAPYKGRETAPEGQAAQAPADKPETEVEETTTTYEADKPGDEAPVEEEVAEELTEEEEAEADDSQEVPDVDLIRMRSDYTKKTQMIAEERRAIEARERQLAERFGVYEQVDALIARNPELARTHTVEQLVTMIQQGTQPSATQQASLPPEVQRELASMRREVAETKESLFVDRVQSSVRRIAKEHGLKREATEQLVRFAIEDEQIAPGMDIERINRRLTLLARGMTYKNAETKGQQKLVKKLVEKGKAASGGTSNATAVEPSQPRVKGWDALVKHYTKGRSG